MSRRPGSRSSRPSGRLSGKNSRQLETGGELRPSGGVMPTIGLRMVIVMVMVNGRRGWWWLLTCSIRPSWPSAPGAVCPPPGVGLERFRARAGAGGGAAAVRSLEPPAAAAARPSRSPPCPAGSRASPGGGSPTLHPLTPQPRRSLARPFLSGPEIIPPPPRRRPRQEQGGNGGAGVRGGLRDSRGGARESSRGGGGRKPSSGPAWGLRGESAVSDFRGPPPAQGPGPGGDLGTDVCG